MKKITGLFFEFVFVSLYRLMRFGVPSFLAFIFGLLGLHFITHPVQSAAHMKYGFVLSVLVGLVLLLGALYALYSNGRGLLKDFRA